MFQSIRSSCDKLEDLGWKVLPHPAYILDLDPFHFHLFQLLKDALRAKIYAKNAEDKTSVQKSKTIYLSSY